VTNGNEFPVRVSLKDIQEITDAGKIDSAEFIQLVQNGYTTTDVVVIETLRGLHTYMLSRRIDPGFQVVLND